MTRAPHDAWSRRDFMRNGFSSVALVCTFATTASVKNAPRVVTSAARRAQAKSVFAPFARDLPIAPTLAPVSTSQGVDVYEVDIKEGLAEILPGFETPIYGYEGIYPGPTIRAVKGRPAIVRQKNNLSFDSNVHLHGGYVPAKHDGHPMDVIAPGKGFDYTYPNDQDAAFLWYHDHAHGRTAHTLYYGLVGTYLLADEREAELELPTRASSTCRWCWPTTRSTATARSATSRTSTSGSAGTRCWSTARSRRGWPCSAGSTGCGS